jgi:hypothetical protein
MVPFPDLITTALATVLVPRLTPWSPLLVAKPAGLVELAVEAEPPPIVMSAPDPEVVELSSVRFPKVTPPASPVVFDQKVIGPLEVLIRLGLPLSPALPVMRPTDFTRIP